MRQLMLLMAFVCVLIQQVANGMEMGKEDSDEEKIAALSAVVAVGEAVYVKVVEIKEDDGSGRCRNVFHCLASTLVTLQLNVYHVVM